MHGLMWMADYLCPILGLILTISRKTGITRHPIHPIILHGFSMECEPRLFPSNFLKIEIWLINGWQSYATFNSNPGFGGNITWIPNENVKLLTNDYYGQDDAGLLGRHRFHSDNSLLVRYFHRPKSSKGVTQMAFSLTGDIGFEQGDGVNGFNGFKTGTDSTGYAQYFASAMFYNRIWFAHGKLAWMIGGGVMTNPGRYLVLEPTGQASDLPTPTAVALANGTILQTTTQDRY